MHSLLRSKETAYFVQVAAFFEMPKQVGLHTIGRSLFHDWQAHGQGIKADYVGTEGLF